MSKKNYHVNLRDEEYIQLRQYVRDGGKSARFVNRSRILLLADEQLTDEQIVETLGVSMATVYRIRKNYHEGGVDKALQEKPRNGANIF